MPERPLIISCVTNDLNHDQRMQRICTSLQSSGFDVCLVGRLLPDSKSLSDQTFQQHRLSCFFLKGKMFYLEYNLRLFFYLLTRKAYLFNAVDLDTIVPVYLASVLKRTRRSFDAHELFPEVPELIGRPFTKSIWQWVEHTFMKKFPIRYCVSSSIAEYYQSSYDLRFEVIRNMPRKVIFPNSEHKGYLLYQGALNKGRGLEQLLQAMPQIDMPLWIAGEGDLSDELRKLAAQLNLSDSKVKFLGKLAPAELSEITRYAFAGFNLLESESKSYYFSLANKFYDYIQLGIPCITMDFPEYRRINSEFKVAELIKDLSVQEIICALEELKDPLKYREYQDNCRKAADVLCWENEEPKLIQLYVNS